MAKWLPPHGFTGSVHHLDATVWRTCRTSFTHFSTGQGKSLGGTYLELIPNERMRHTGEFDDPALPGKMQTTVSLKPVSCGTELDIVPEGSLPARARRTSHVKASIFVGTSLDGFIARPNGAFDFLSPGGVEPEPHGFEEFLATVDALVMGRNTYETVLPFPEWPYGPKPVFVLSHRPLPAAPRGAVVERMAGTPPEVHAQLASRGFAHVYVDGGITIQAFLRAGLIQRLVISRVPVLIGAGIPLFGELDRDVPLRHIATRPFPSGLVQSEYAVEPRPMSKVVPEG